jgi:hypothetical protein
VLTPTAVFSIPGTPDWQVITDDAVWVSNGPKHAVHRLDVKTNKEEVGKRPCSGLAAGFGSVWAALCGDRPNVGNAVKPALATHPGDGVPDSAVDDRSEDEHGGRGRRCGAGGPRVSVAVDSECYAGGKKGRPVKGGPLRKQKLEAQP